MAAGAAVVKPFATDVANDVSLNMISEVAVPDADMPTISPAVFGASLGMAGFGNAFLFWKIFLPSLTGFANGVLIASRCVSVCWLAKTGLIGWSEKTEIWKLIERFFINSDLGTHFRKFLKV